MIQLFDYYNQETQDLHDSLLAAGYDCPTIVIEANGFLPDDMISPYTYFLGDEEGADHPLFSIKCQCPLSGKSQATIRRRVSVTWEKKEHGFTMPVRPRAGWSSRWTGWIKKASCD